MPSKEKYLLVIAGPTSSGKTELSVSVAKHFNTEIISADARQFYREMRIGTSPPNDNQLAAVQHHFIHSISIHDTYDAGSYEKDVIRLLEELFQKHDVVLLCGGSGLFIRAVTDGFDILPDVDPDIRKQLMEEFKLKGLPFLQEKLKAIDRVYFHAVDVQNPRRLLRAIEVSIAAGVPYSTLRKSTQVKRPFKSIKVCLDVERSLLYERIDQRVDQMIANGLESEAKELYPFRKLTALQTVGYRELFAYFDGTISLNRAIELIKQHSRNYAKRQITWFKKDPEFAWMQPVVSTIIQFTEKQMQRSF